MRNRCELQQEERRMSVEGFEPAWEEWEER